MPFKFFARYVKAKPIDTSGLLTLLYLKSDSNDKGDILVRLSPFQAEIFSKEGGFIVNILFDVLLGVLINVIAHGISKWLDSKDNHDS